MRGRRRVKEGEGMRRMVKEGGKEGVKEGVGKGV